MVVVIMAIIIIIIITTTTIISSISERRITGMIFTGDLTIPQCWSTETSKSIIICTMHHPRTQTASMVQQWCCPALQPSGKTLMDSNFKVNLFLPLYCPFYYCILLFSDHHYFFSNFVAIHLFDFFLFASARRIRFIQKRKRCTFFLFLQCSVNAVHFTHMLLDC